MAAEAGGGDGAHDVISGKKRPAPSKGSQQPKKAKLVSRKKKAGFDEEVLSETTYFIKDGLRYVKPYYFTFTTHAKGRWVGSTVYDVFCREFQSETPEYYKRAINTGKVTVNGEKAETETIIRDNDLICHLVHRHEPPVTSTELAILHEDDDLVVVNKPASIPIHPCGRYRHNTVLFLLAKEHNLRNLHTVHRLDRLTSGLLILAKSMKKAQELEVEIRERKVCKEYVCRVQGEFPSTPVQCDEPILIISHKLGLSHVDPKGKLCSTHFTRLSYNGHTSVIKCQPKTGRMHQIRVHLQWLGHPIVNDPLYNHPAWQEVNRNKSANLASGDVQDSSSSGSVDMERVVSAIVKSRFAHEEEAGEHEGHGGDDGDGGKRSGGGEDIEETEEGQGGKEEQAVRKREQEKEEADGKIEEDYPDPDMLSPPSSKTVTSSQSSSSDALYDLDCTECQLSRSPPSPEELVMYLHALSYKGNGWSFSTPLPDWAKSE